jgi:N-acetylmuramoyl-L-alanine amidase
MSWALETAARTLCQEARGEPLDGQQAVAYVIKNRLESDRWGKSLASVCLWRAQFSGWYVPSDPNFAYACDLPDDDATLSHMMSVMQVVMDSNIDPTGGALFYYANSMPAPPSWAATMRFCGMFGHQSFYSDQPKPETLGT